MNQESNAHFDTNRLLQLRPGRGKVAVELCAGVGGIGIGLRALGFEIGRAYDAWDQAVDAYNHNSSEAVASVCDLLRPSAVRRVRKECRGLGEVDILAAGPPCKGFSQLRNGHQHTPNPHNRVLSAMPDFVAALRPRFFVLENVPDLARHAGGRTLKRLATRLAKPAPRAPTYHVDFAVFDAAQFGVPQARRRMLILGVREDVDWEQFALPEPGPDLRPLFSALRHGNPLPDALRFCLSALRDTTSLTLTTARQALSDLPRLPAGAGESSRKYACPPRNAFQRMMRRRAPSLVANTQTPDVKEETVQRLLKIPPGGCARDIPAHLLNGLSRRYDSAYRRLHPDVPSTALSTKYDCVYHYQIERSLSVREYARLQGFPDHICIPEEVACRRSAYEMIGNAVPPLLVQGVLAAVLEGGR